MLSLIHKQQAHAACSLWEGTPRWVRGPSVGCKPSRLSGSLRRGRTWSVAVARWPVGYGDESMRLRTPEIERVESPPNEATGPIVLSLPLPAPSLQISPE